MIARVVRAGKVLEEVPLRYAGEKSSFAGQVPLATAGLIELEVLALDPANANFGLARQSLTVVP